MGFQPAIYSHRLTSNLKRAISIADCRQIILICDEHTKKFCLPHLSEIKFNSIYTIISGEENKSIASAMNLINFLLTQNFDKKTLLIALGGGMVTDLTGFVASIYKRGIAYINVPTTLLCMVDAGIGAKTGVDHLEIKNCIGTIYPALGIYSDAKFLGTLPKTELLSGWAEVVKHHLIANIALPEFSKMNAISNEDVQDWANIKHHIIKADPFEKNQRLALNAGHTLGHAIESYFLKMNQTIPHGMAVAAGLWIESFICKTTLKDDWVFKQLEHYIFDCFGKLSFDEQAIDAIINFAKNDKKNTLNGIVCSLLKTHGKLQVEIIEEQDLRMGIRHYIDFKC